MNPTLDVATHVERLFNHQKLRCDSETEQVGGGGINVAQVMHSLGAHCVAAFTSGGWRGKDIERRLCEEDGIECLSLPIAQESRQCFTAYETSTAHEYRFILPGPTLSESEWRSALERLVEASLDTGWLIGSGSLPPGVPSDFYYQLLERVNDTNVQTAIDTSGKPLAKALTSKIDLIKPSREELSQLLGSPLSTVDECLHACQGLLQKFNVKTIALSLGRQGALVCQEAHYLHVEPLPVQVTSTVGAGDSFLGGFVWALAQQSDLSTAAQIATAAAASALQTQGKLRFNRNDILKNAEKVIVSCA